MKNITNSSNIRNINGGSLGIDVLIAMGMIGGAAGACKAAWDLGDWLGTKLGEAIFG